MTVEFDPNGRFPCDWAYRITVGKLRIVVASRFRLRFCWMGTACRVIERLRVVEERKMRSHFRWDPERQADEVYLGLLDEYWLKHGHARTFSPEQLAAMRPVWTTGRFVGTPEQVAHADALEAAWSAGRYPNGDPITPNLPGDERV